AGDPPSDRLPARRGGRTPAAGERPRQDTAQAGNLARRARRGHQGTAQGTAREPPGLRQGLTAEGRVFRPSGAELRRTLEIITRAHQEAETAKKELIE